MRIFNRLFSGGFRLATVVLAGLATTLQAASIEESLPKNTLVFARITNAKALREAFKASQFGQMIADPALKSIREEVTKNLEKMSAEVKNTAGASLESLLEMPTGEMILAVVPKADEKVPAGFYASLDAGESDAAFAEAMGKLVKFGTEKGAKVSSETFNNVSINVISSEIKGDNGEVMKSTFAVAKTGTIYHVAESADTLKSVIKGAGADSLASLDDFKKAVAKANPLSQIRYFANVPSILKIGIRAASANVDNAAVDAQQIESIVSMIGLNGLKAISGSITLNDAKFEAVASTTLHLNKPTEGLLKVFTLKPSKMEPESWVPANVTSYQSLGWDFDTAYTAINEIANMFSPGILNVLEQQLVGPNGGEPLSFQKDIFGPMGSRVSIISDVVKPIKDDSQRMLVGVALDDSATFNKTLLKLFELAGQEPKKREFQGTTIYDIEPDLPAAGGVNIDSGKLSIAIAKDTLFVTSNVTLLEAVLRGGYEKLADSASYKTVAKNFPASTATISFTATEESARATYEMLRLGTLERAAEAAAGQLPGAPNVDLPFDPKKLPDFSVFAKYLTNGGGFSVTDEDGVTSTQFLIRKSGP
jgi:hypothetical protein